MIFKSQQSNITIQYIDPDSHTVRSYYPDFIFQREDDSYVIVEVKADNQIDDNVVNAKKAYATQIAVASGMEYRLIKASDAEKHHYRVLLQIDSCEMKQILEEVWV